MTTIKSDEALKKDVVKALDAFYKAPREGDHKAEAAALHTAVLAMFPRLDALDRFRVTELLGRAFQAGGMHVLTTINLPKL